MMLITSIKTLNRYILLAESRSVNYVKPRIFQTLEENLYDYGSFYEISVIAWLVSADVQLIRGLSQVFLDGFRSFQVVSRFSENIDVLIENSV